MFQDTIRTGGNDHFERGCRWFQLFFIDFQLFYFLTRIIPAFKTYDVKNEFSNRHNFIALCNRRRNNYSHRL